MYRTIDTATWTDPKVQFLPPKGKLLWVYLITNQHSHVGGIYYILDSVICHETGLSQAELDTLWHTLSGAELVSRDRDLSIVWVKKMFWYQGRGAKNECAVARHLGTLHNSFLIQEFLQMYPRVKNRVSDRVLHRVSDRVSDSGSNSHSGTGTGTGIQEPPKPPLDEFSLKPSSNGKPKKPGRSRVRSEPNPYSEDFERFWDLFPRIRREKKGKAWEAWQKAICRATPEVILDAVEEFSESELARTDRCQGPAPWLNDDCWSDERAAWNPSRSAKQLIDRVATKEDLANWRP